LLSDTETAANAYRQVIDIIERYGISEINALCRPKIASPGKV